MGWTVQRSNPDGGEIFVPVPTGPGVHPASCTMGTGSFPGVKRPRRGLNHPPTSSAEVKKEWRYTSTAPLGFHKAKETAIAEFYIQFKFSLLDVG